MFPRPPQRPAPAPPRPSTLPRQVVPENFDDQNHREFGIEFDAIPLPDQAQAQANAPVCDSSNMKYIKSRLAMPHIGLQDFYVRMAKRQWQAAQPFVRRDAGPMHVAKGMLAIGARRDLVAKPVLQEPVRTAFPGGYATDWNLIPGLDRVNAYVFRGDKRGPRTVRAVGGFHPPSSRKDDRYAGVIARRFASYMKTRYNQDVAESDIVQYVKGQGTAGKVFTEYEMWRAILKNEELHIGRMVADEFLKGFISTTRSINTAVGFLTGASADGNREPVGAIYALHSEGGFLLPPQAQHVHGTKINENEIAHPGALPWNKVIGFRTSIVVDFNNDRTFQKTKVIWIRKGLLQADPKGIQQVIWALASVTM